MAKRTRSEAATAPSPMLVHFEFIRRTMEQVCIAGAFNTWHCPATPMIAMGEGRRARKLLLPPGTHECRFIVGGEWVTHRPGKKTVANPFGSHNTIFRVQAPA